LGGIAGNSLALASHAGGGRGGILSSLAQLDKQAGLAQKASLPNLGMKHQMMSPHRAIAALQGSPSTARMPHGIAPPGTKANAGSHINLPAPTNKYDTSLVVRSNFQEFNRTDVSMGTQKGN